MVVLFLGGCKTGTSNTRVEENSRPTEAARGRQDIRLTSEAIKTIGLHTEPARARELERQLVTTASIKPNEYRLAHVSPRISGKAVEVYAKLGDNVKKGAVLAELDSLELGAKKAAFLRAEADLNVARRNYDREKALYAKQISSERDYLAAKGDFERSEAAYNEAREALRLLDLPDSAIARITWNDADGRLSWFPLVSPFSGTIIERHITVGEQIKPDETVLTIADLDVVWLLADIYEKDIARVAVRDPVQVTVDTFPGEAFHGRIAYLSNTVDPATRTASARVEIDNFDHRLRIGMFATARIALRAPPEQGTAAIAVPLDAVQRIGPKTVVFIEEKPGVYLPREVALAGSSANDAEISSGLAAGERVVTKGSFYLKSVLMKESIAGEE